MKRIFLFVFLCLILLGNYAQTDVFTMQEAVIGQWRELYPKTLWNAQWQGNSHTFTFQDKQILYQQSVSNSDSIKLVTLAKLNESVQRAGFDSLATFPAIQWESATEFSFYCGASWLVYHLKEGKITCSIKLPQKAENSVVNFQKKQIAFTIGNNLYLMGTDNQLIPVTQETDKGIVCGQTVSRNEFGISGGIFWSPKGTYIAFYRKDERKVADYPLVDVTAREAELSNIKYPMAGMASEHISLGVYCIENKITLFIEKEDITSEKYLTNISWDPEETFIYIQVLNRDQNHMKMNKYQVADGNLQATLFEEKNDKYVEPSFPITFVPEQNNQFIYQSRRDGFNHLYLCNTDGRLLKQLTMGAFEVINVLKVGKKNIFFTSTEAGPLERQLYRVEINSGKKTRLTNQAGTHQPIIDPTESYFIDLFSSTTVPSRIDVYSSNGKLLRNVLTDENPLKRFNMPEMVLGTLKAADGITDLYYRMIKPINFDSTAKYPAVVYVYGGPHAQLVENSWLGGARLWEYLMAQKGYVMFTIDNRGSANRGLAFENVIHRQCGVHEMKDQLQGIQFMKSLGFVDMTRIGVHGWSYGGFVTSSLMVNYPELFKVGVAGGPVIDWKYYEVMYGERYMDTPEQNPEGYLFTSLLPRAKNLKGKLMIIHGAMDNTVVWQNSQQFLNECIKNQIPVDYFVYPRAEHNVRGYDRIHLMQKVTDYFEDYLRPLKTE